MNLTSLHHHILNLKCLYLAVQNQLPPKVYIVSFFAKKKLEENETKGTMFMLLYVTHVIYVMMVVGIENSNKIVRSGRNKQ